MNFEKGFMVKCPRYQTSITKEQTGKLKIKAWTKKKGKKIQALKG